MKIFLMIFGLFVVATGFATFPTSAAAPLVQAAPLMPDAGEQLDTSATSTPAPKAVATPATASASKSAATAVTVPAGPDYPVRVSIPAIGLNNQVVPVGLNDKGEMAVPSGNTSNIGWYKNGTVPGEVGSAVFDAHVFAAFAKLDQLAAGSDIYVTFASGKKLHFVVQEAVTHTLAGMSADELFNRTDARRLNLITCAGQLTPDKSTYDHRLVISAIFAD